MKPHIPYGKQCIDDDDIEAVIEALRSEWITQGPNIARFEQSVTQYTGARYAVAVSSGTAALHLSCLALGLSAGDIFWTSANSFVASANCAYYCGATADFIDINLSDYTLDMEALATKLKQAAKRKCLPKIVVPVHFAGCSCEMGRIAELAQYYGFHVIEDASHALGAHYNGQKVGACHYSDLAVFSFHPVKMITTGEGGMVVTNNEHLYQKLLRLRTHGITRVEQTMVRKPDGPWYYEQHELGFNYRMTDIQAALGMSQLNRLAQFVSKRRLLASRYRSLLRTLPLRLPRLENDMSSSWHLFVVLLEQVRAKLDRRSFFDAMRACNIGVNVHYIPIYKQPFYQQRGFHNYQLDRTEYYYQHALTLPLYQSMSYAEQDYIVATIEEILCHASS